MAQLRFRPHGVGDIIRASFTIYRKRFGPIMAVTVSVVFIPFFVSVVGGCAIGRTGDVSCDSVLGLLGYVGSEIGFLVAGAGVTLVAATAYVGRSPDWRRSAAAGLIRMIPLLFLYLLIGIPVILVFLVVLAPGMLAGLWILSESLAIIAGPIILVISIIMMVSFAVAVPVLMIEGVRPMQGMRRSWHLVSGERWRLFGAGLLLCIIFGISFGIISEVVYLVLSGAGMNEGDANYFSLQLFILLLVPLVSVAEVVLYVDLRSRKEELDGTGLGAHLARADVLLD